MSLISFFVVPWTVGGKIGSQSYLLHAPHDLGMYDILFDTGGNQHHRPNSRYRSGQSATNGIDGINSQTNLGFDDHIVH